MRPPTVEQVLPELASEAAAVRATRVPWFVLIPVALGLTVASAFLCSGFWMFLESRPLVGAAGVSIGLASIAASWLPLPWFSRPVVLAGAILSRALVFASVANFSTWGWEVYGSMAATEFTMLLLHRDPLSRAVAAATLPIWLLEGNKSLTAVITSFALLGGGATLVLRRYWLGWPGPVREILSALVMGWLGLALVMPSIEGPDWSWVFSVVVGAVASVIAVVVAQRAAAGWPSVVGAGLVAVSLAAFTVPVPGVLVALVVALFGFVSGSPRLWISSVGAMAAYGVYFYYDLDLTLVVKGGAMIGAGVVLLAMGAFAGRFRERAPTVTAAPRAAIGWLERGLVALGAVFAFVVVGGAVGVQEVQLARSEVVYLPLAPVDPRSLVQGDFMRLRYTLENDLRRARVTHGTAILKVDKNRIGTFAGLEDGQVDADELKVNVFDTNRGPAVASRGYLFQEGQANEYSRAAYGIIAITPEGRAALTGLADADRKRLGPPPRRW